MLTAEDDALRGHRERVLVPHARQQEGDLELGGPVGRGRVQLEGLQVAGLAWLDDSGRLGHHGAHVVQRAQHAGLPAGVGPVDHHAAQSMGHRHWPRRVAQAPAGFRRLASVPVVFFPLVANRAHDDVVADDLEENDVARAAEWNDQFARATIAQFCSTA
jgi:hypothetical protein